MCQFVGDKHNSHMYRCNDCNHTYLRNMNSTVFSVCMKDIDKYRGKKSDYSVICRRSHWGPKFYCGQIQASIITKTHLRAPM